MTRGADDRVRGIGRRQFELVTPAQARGAGMSRRTIDRRVSDGGWERWSTRVLALPDGDPTLERYLMAAQLHQPTAVASVTGAERLHDLPFLVDVEPGGHRPLPRQQPEPLRPAPPVG